MSEQWLKDIADRVSEFEVDEPQGLWTAVESHRRKAREVLWWRRVAVASAFAAVLGVGIYFAVRESGTQPQQPVVAEVAKPEAAQLQQSAPQPPISGPTPVAHPTPAKVLAQAAAEPVLIPHDTIAEPHATEGDTVAVRQTEQPVRHQLPPVEVATTTNQPATSTGPVTEYTSADDHLQLALFTSGGTGASLNHSLAPITTNAAGPLAGGRWDGDPYTGILVYNKGVQTANDIHHRLPVRFGINFAMPLSDRLSIGSGITYTNLTSDTFEGSSHSYVDGRQTLHYVGIPLSLSCNLLTVGRFDTYTTVGAMAEKAVCGRHRQTYILNGSEAQTTTTDTLLPWQLSLTLSVGFQYRFTSNLGIFAEPGLQYYLPDNSSLRTIYSDKPLNFSLNLGLRLFLQR